MNDMAPTIVPKSDQLNADDLIAGPRTVHIQGVKITPGTEQPVAVRFEGDGNKPYLPCKSMRRVMVAVWGADASAYTGRSMTLYRDPKVTYGGMEMGGIRISHMSHITEKTVVVLTANKKTRKPFTVLPLATPPKPVNTAPPASSDPAEAFAAEVLAKIDAALTADDLHTLAGDSVISKKRDRLKIVRPELDQEISDALATASRRVERIIEQEEAPF